MANLDRPSGFLPAYHLTGGEIRTREYLIDSNTASALAKGDPVKLETNGNVELAAAGDVLLGVFAGCVYTDNLGQIHYSDYIPATKTSFTNMVAYVWDDPFIVFVAQHDSDSATPAVTGIGACFDHVVAAASAVVKISQCEIDTNTVTNVDGQWKCIGLWNSPDNVWGDYAKALVIPNEHIFKAVAGI